MRNLLVPAASALALRCAAGPLVVTASAAQTAMASLTSAQRMDCDTGAPDQRTADAAAARSDEQGLSGLHQDAA